MKTNYMKLVVAAVVALSVSSAYAVSYGLGGNGSSYGWLNNNQHEVSAPRAPQGGGFGGGGGGFSGGGFGGGGGHDGFGGGHGGGGGGGGGSGHGVPDGGNALILFGSALSGLALLLKRN